MSFQRSKVCFGTHLASIKSEISVSDVGQSTTKIIIVSMPCKESTMQKM